MLLDGEPVRSCLMFAVQAAGKKIRTVEGLADGDRLHPMQQAFMDHHGLQCGFCTPGFLMLAVGVLEREPDISDADLARRAVVEPLPLHRLSEHHQGGARGGEGDARKMTAPGKFIGRSVPRLEDRPLLTGQGRFAADVNFPGQWHMRVVRSPVAHGKIRNIDASAALRLPGVHAVWTFADMAHIPPIGFRLTGLTALEPYRQ